MIQFNLVCTDSASSFSLYFVKQTHLQYKWKPTFSVSLQKGGVPAAPSGTATLLRLSPNREPHLRRLPPQQVRPPASGAAHFHDLTGGVYKARERIHRGTADPRLLATPPSRGRVAGPDPN